MTEAAPTWLEQLRSSLDIDAFEPAMPAARSGDGGQQAGRRRPAAVLILFGQAAGGPDLLFVERSAALRFHPGQVAFPGGGHEPDDPDLTRTALREAAEETGLDPSGVVVLGRLAQAEVPVSGYRVLPVLAWWQRPSPITAADPGEIAAVHRIEVATLTDPDNRYAMAHPNGRLGPGFLIGDLLIWGFTAYLLDNVLSRAGWQRPWDRQRTMTVPDRYLGRAPVVDEERDRR